MSRTHSHYRRRRYWFRQTLRRTLPYRWRHWTRRHLWWIRADRWMP